jgi:hypothetical protein
VQVQIALSSTRITSRLRAVRRNPANQLEDCRSEIVETPLKPCGKSLGSFRLHVVYYRLVHQSYPLSRMTSRNMYGDPFDA